eukprot:s1010_g13.t1
MNKARVLQDLMRLIHNMLPLERIKQDCADAAKPKGTSCCWNRSKQDAYNFANSHRFGKLVTFFEKEWFHAGEDEHGAEEKYGIKAAHIVDATNAVVEWMLPRALAQVAENQAWRTTLKFHGFSMTEDEIRELAASAVALSHVRWQWLTCWLRKEREGDHMTAGDD